MWNLGTRKVHGSSANQNTTELEREFCEYGHQKAWKIAVKANTKQSGNKILNYNINFKLININY